MTLFVAAHAFGASLALVLGAYQLWYRPKGDARHRFVGWVWVALMYWTVLSSFGIQELRPGRFSWIHGLSVLTFVTLSLGVWGALTGRVQVHRGNMIGSYLGLVGAFVGAVVVPARDIPQLALNRPLLLFVVVLGCLGVAGSVVAVGGRLRRPQPEGRVLARR